MQVKFKHGSIVRVLDRNHFYGNTHFRIEDYSTIPLDYKTKTYTVIYKLQDIDSSLVTHMFENQLELECE